MLSQIFKVTQDWYGISSQELSRRTGIAASTISDIRRGKRDPSCNTLWRLILAMDEIAPGSKQFFCDRLSGGAFDPALFLQSLKPQQFADLTFAIFQHLQNNRLDSSQNQETLVS